MGTVISSIDDIVGVVYLLSIDNTYVPIIAIEIFM